MAAWASIFLEIPVGVLEVESAKVVEHVPIDLRHEKGA